MKTAIDRDSWGHGPWDREVDEYAWQWEGVSCLILRQIGGYLCGYVGVPDGVVYDRHALDDAAHGGVTFEGKMRGSDLVWVGFDCAHGGDSMPAVYDYGEGMYRDVEYVRSCVNRMAEIVSEALKQVEIHPEEEQT